MATRKGGPLAQLQRRVQQIRKEGERLATRLGKDVQALTKRSRGDIQGELRRLQKDLRGRAESTLRDLEKRRAQMLRDVERQVRTTAETVLKRLHAATTSDLATLGRRVAEVEKRLAALEGRGGKDVSAAG